MLNWIQNKQPLDPGSDNFIWHADDFVSLTGSSTQGGGSKQQDLFERITKSLAVHRPFSVSLCGERGVAIPSEASTY